MSRTLALCISLALSTFAGCASSGKETVTPDHCMRRCEGDCPGKGGGGQGTFDKYVQCVDACEQKCGDTPAG